MSTNYIGKFLKQSSIYFASTLVMTMLSMVSFPIWTRVFTTAEYGVMSLASTTLALLLIFSKMGIQHAVLRFYYEFKKGKRDLDITYLFTTALYVTVIFGLAVSTLYSIAAKLLFSHALEEQFLKIVYLLPILVVFGSINDIFLMFFRADQNAKKHSLVNIYLQITRLGASVLFGLYLKLGLFGYFTGWAIVDIVTAIILMGIFARQKKIRWGHFSMPLIREALVYGFPLFGSEIAFVLLATGDRYLLQLLMDSSAVGIYSACYNVVDYAISFFCVPYRLAIMPIYMKIWEEKGALETQKFLVTMQNYYFMIGIPIVFGLVGVGQELITLLASSKYASGSTIFPYVAIGILIYNAHFMYAAGFYLIKKTTNLFKVNLAGIILNVILNLILIPIMGIMGSAVATLVAYALVAAIMMKMSFVHLKVGTDLLSVGKYLAASVVMYLVLSHIMFEFGIAQIFLKIFIGIVVYFVIILLIDANSRRVLGNLIHRRSVFSLETQEAAGRIESN
jgi:O-antigen/teichoic acid export membrane protein